MIDEYSLTQTAAPAEEPVSRSEAKLAARIEHTAEDTYIDELITAARLYAETFTARQFVTATWEMKLDGFPEEIETPRPPLQKVNTIKYYDTGGVLQTLSASLYTVDTHTEPGRIVPAYGQVWPVTRDVIGAVEVNYDAGYGAAATVPETIKLAIKLLVAHWYKLREPVITGTIASKIPLSVESLLIAASWGCYA